MGHGWLSKPEARPATAARDRRPPAARRYATLRATAFGSRTFQVLLGTFSGVNKAPPAAKVPRIS